MYFATFGRIVLCESTNRTLPLFFVVTAENEFVFINFYADWCRFSNMLAPIWDEAADKVAGEFGGGRVIVGKVDCDKHGKILGPW